MITLVNQDCLKYLTLCPSESVDLVVVDPPYGINYKAWDKIDFKQFTFQWVQECFRILKPTGTMWSFMGYQHVLDFIPILSQFGTVHLENWVIWARQKGRGSSKHLKSQREDIFHVTKSNNFIWNPIKVLREVVCPYVKDGKPRGWFLDENGKRVRWTGLGNVWTYSSPFWNSKSDKSYHPAQKPLMLLERLILLSSNKEDTVLDPFMGSGSTGIAATKHKRNFIGIEIDPNWYNIATERLSSQ